MNIHGYKKNAEKALSLERYWAKQIARKGAFARIKAGAFKRFKIWNLKKAKELKEKKKR